MTARDPRLAEASAAIRATLEQMGQSLDGLMVRDTRPDEPPAGEAPPTRMAFHADAPLERAIRDGAAAAGLTVAAFLRRTLRDALLHH